MDGDHFLAEHVFCFNPNDNGGESLILSTELVGNGDPGHVGMFQTLTLDSYSNSASFNLSSGLLSPSNLRKLADELEAAENKARSYLTNG